MDRDAAEDAAGHAPFRAAFLAWLDGAAGRFALPVTADTASPAHTGLHIHGVHPAIWVSLSGDWDISAGAEWNGVFWDLLASLDVAEQPVPGGWENAFVLPEARITHPTREALWRSDGFEPLLDWVNEELASATYLALWGSDGHATWAWLVRDGVALRTGWTMASKPAPAHLLPVHGADTTAWVQPVGQAWNTTENRGAAMAIGSAVQRGGYVYVYDERGRQLAMVPAGSGADDGLKGYTGASVSVRRGAYIYTYNETGQQVSMAPAR